MSTSKRLTNGNRETLAAAMLKHGFEKREEKLVDARAKFAHKLFNHFFKPAELKRLEEAPEGWYPEIRDFTVETPDGRRSFSFAGKPFFDRNPQSVGSVLWTSMKNRTGRRRRIPYKMTCNGGIVGVFSRNEKICKAFEAIQELQLDFANDYHRVKIETNAALSAFTTTKGLVEGWPEIEPFVSLLLPVETRIARNLPAPPLGDLNRSLGLPPAEAAL